MEPLLMTLQGELDVPFKFPTTQPKSIASWLQAQAPTVWSAISQPECPPALAYIICQVLSLYVEGTKGIHLEPFDRLAEKKNGDVPGLTIANQNARVFVGTGAKFDKVVISGNGEAFIFIGQDAVLTSCNIACHAMKNYFVAGFNCKLDGLFTHIYATIGAVILGPGVTSQSGCNFCVQENSYLLIGSDSMLSTNVFMRTSDSHGIYDNDTRARINPARPIVLHPHTWVSRAATLNKGTEIGENSILGQGAVANGPIKASCIYAGAPASLVRANVTWDRRSADQIGETHDYLSGHFLASFKANREGMLFLEAPTKDGSLSRVSFSLSNPAAGLLIDTASGEEGDLQDNINSIAEAMVNASVAAKARLSNI
jgi:acetyltransferase-like isoleucine patch superfamily enzyme